MCHRPGLRLHKSGHAMLMSRVRNWLWDWGGSMCAKHDERLAQNFSTVLVLVIPRVYAYVNRVIHAVRRLGGKVVCKPGRPTACTGVTSAFFRDKSRCNDSKQMKREWMCDRETTNLYLPSTIIHTSSISQTPHWIISDPHVYGTPQTKEKGGNRVALIERDRVSEGRENGKKDTRTHTLSTCADTEKETAMKKERYAA